MSSEGVLSESDRARFQRWFLRRAHLRHKQVERAQCQDNLGPRGQCPGAHELARAGESRQGIQATGLTTDRQASAGADHPGAPGRGSAQDLRHKSRDSRGFAKQVACSLEDGGPQAQSATRLQILDKSAVRSPAMHCRGSVSEPARASAGALGLPEPPNSVDQVRPAQPAAHARPDTDASPRRQAPQRPNRACGLLSVACLASHNDEHPAIELHFTPNCVLGLHLMKRLLRDLNDEPLRLGVVRRVAELEPDIVPPLKQHREDPNPYRWNAIQARRLRKAPRANES